VVETFFLLNPRIVAGLCIVTTARRTARGVLPAGIEACLFAAVIKEGAGAAVALFHSLPAFAHATLLMHKVGVSRALTADVPVPTDLVASVALHMNWSGLAREKTAEKLGASFFAAFA
jgi:hypothetical protein